MFGSKRIETASANHPNPVVSRLLKRWVVGNPSSLPRPPDRALEPKIVRHRHRHRDRCCVWDAGGS